MIETLIVFGLGVVCGWATLFVLALVMAAGRAEEVEREYWREHEQSEPE